MRIFLIRHGEWHERLKSLSPTGEEQVEKAAAVLRQQGLMREETVILASPLERALVSAKVLADRAGLGDPLPMTWLSEGESSSKLQEGFNSLFEFYLVGVKAFILVSHELPIENLIALQTHERITVGHGDVYELEVENRKATKLTAVTP